MLRIQGFLLTAAMAGLMPLLAGCAGRPAQGVLVPNAAAATAATVDGTTRVRILAATTRQRATGDAGEMFNGVRADQVSYAGITVSIPPDASRKIGDVQWPDSLPGDPRRDFVTVAADYLEQPSFNAALSAELKQVGTGKVLIFVHGFNNRFDEAVYRLAQIVHDSKVPAVPVLFAWPSRGEVRLSSYTYDRESANYSRDALEQLFDMLTLNPNVKEVTVLAHSMGNVVALEALRARAIRNGKIGDKIKNVLLVAPDVDVDVFRTEIRRMGTNRPQFAIFLSQDDQALKLSSSIWGGVPRIGDIDPTQEPYSSEFAQDNILVFDLSRLGGEAHSRAFTSVTTVVGMLQQRLAEGQQMTASRSSLSDASR
jgi:esterase/lipase superfamily enzyme